MVHLWNKYQLQTAEHLTYVGVQRNGVTLNKFYLLAKCEKIQNIGYMILPGMNKLSFSSENGTSIA